MEYENFTNQITSNLACINIELPESKIRNFYSYMEELIEWNKKINLTAIVKPDEVIDKHFIDSLTISQYLKDNEKIIDVGTGAGFPGVPIKIAREDIQIDLLDSLNKRVIFLKDIINKLNLKKINAIHGRAEDEGKNINRREKYDVAVSRAVANLPVLLEYLLPFVKIGGKCICMKGMNIGEEVNNSKRALKELGGEIEEINKFNLPNIDATRNIIIIRKREHTPKKYPRKAGTAIKTPII